MFHYDGKPITPEKAARILAKRRAEWDRERMARSLTDSDVKAKALVHIMFTCLAMGAILGGIGMIVLEAVVK
ncbi:MAG: hypothetical protein LCH57_00915 [Proteobacteria bacterium]|nr:hypothetical protein [Pseudomonadota bacterium]